MNSKPWGILNLYNCKVVFRGGNESLRTYFLDFFSSILSKNIFDKCENYIFVDFGDLGKLNLKNIKKYEISNGLFYYEGYNDNSKIFEFSKSWRIIVKQNHIYVAVNKLNKDIDVLNQVLRNVILETIQFYDLISLHSSCIYHNNHIYFFLGYSGTGKSTLAIGLGLNNNYHLINDDRVIVLPEKNLVTHIGTPITFRPSTECLVPKLRDYTIHLGEEYYNDKELKYKTKIGINYKKTYGKERLRIVNGKFIFIFLKEGCSNRLTELDKEKKEKIIHELYENKEITCRKEILNKICESKVYEFEIKKGNKDDFDEMLKYLMLKLDVIEDETR